MVSGAAVRLLLVVALSGGPAGEGEARLSLDVKDAPVVDVVRVLAEAGGLQVVFDPGLDCRLTMKLHEANCRYGDAMHSAIPASEN